MSWRSILTKIIGPNPTTAFGKEAVALASQYQPHVLALLKAERTGAPAPDEAQSWWRNTQAELLRRYPDADRLALSAFLDHGPTQESSNLFRLWVMHRPAPGATEAVYSRLEAMFREAVEGDFTEALRLAIYSVSAAAFSLESPPRDRYRKLVLRVIDHFRGADPANRPLRVGWEKTSIHLLERMLPELGAVPGDQHLIDRMFALAPWLAHAWSQGAVEMNNREVVVASINRYIHRALQGDTELSVYRGLLWYNDYAGIDHFLAACRAFEKHPGVKPPTDRYLDYHAPTATPVTWAVALLRRIKPPSPQDAERAAELASVDRAALTTAILFAPAWSPLAEGHLDWPGFGVIARWLQRYGGAAPWSGYRQHQPQTEEEEESGGIDRGAAVEALELMGEKRYKQLLKHPVVKGLYRDGAFYLEAIRGLNAADVEAKFLKRNKLAVRALGLLPDEGDILQRYLALRRFAKEARQFGSQRQASERMAAESGLANLAETAGYADLAQLEWAMEAQVAAEVDPTSRRWQIDEYEVWIQPDQKATLMVERAGKALKSVPPAVRQAPDYEEIKEAREMLTTQWDRVHRRLEAAMGLGEVMSRETLMQGFTTPAGRAMIPNLVLRCTVDGRPVDLLGGRTLAGEQVALERVETVQVAHPLPLSDGGTLEPWQRRAAEWGVTQPFPQLAREFYRRPAGEKEMVALVAGRKVRVGTCVEQLKRRGWQLNGEHGLMKRLPGRIYANFWFQDGAAYNPAMDILTCGDVWLEPKVNALLYSEVMRDVDLATAAAAPDRSAVR